MTTARPRIVLVAPDLRTPGGQAVQARALATLLRADGFRLTFLSTTPAFPRGLRWVRRWPFVRTALNEALVLPSLRAVRGADAVIVFAAAYWSFVLSALPALVASRLAGARTILAYHSGEADDHLRRWRVLVRPWLKLAHAIVVPSPYLERVFARHGFPTVRIPNVVDTGRFRFRDRRALAPRNLEAHYRVDDVVRAFARLRARHPAATLTIAGVGREGERLRRLAAALGSRGIRFVGAVAPSAMPGLYDDADVFVNASSVDNQPVSVLEAFASGLPVVTTAPGGIADLVEDRRTGRVVPIADPTALAAAVSSLLNEPDRARALAWRARDEVAAYSWPRVRPLWMEVLCRTGIPSFRVREAASYTRS
jgi:glycosyltransferase involved in cell wall biosynthesis